jgi:hypothetical protein
LARIEDCGVVDVAFAVSGKVGALTHLLPINVIISLYLSSSCG